MNEAISNAYSGQSGGDLPYFVGKQYGAGWLRTLARVAFPILKRVLGVATNIGEDVIMNKKKFKTSLKENVVKGVTNYMTGRGPKKQQKKPIKKPAKKKPKKPRMTRKVLTSGINSRERRNFANTIFT